MRNTVVKYVIVFLLLACSGAALMHISHSVQRFEKQVASNQKIIDQEEEAIRVLKAEWAYLNRPERLENMAKRGLDMGVPETKKVISDMENIPAPEESEQAISISYEGRQ